jgi:prepilin peptidase CpaA
MDALSIVPLVVCFTAILIGTITDIRTREVPDWLNYALIFSGLGFGGIMSAVTGQATFIISSLAGLAVFFLLGMLMFYTGQWGGGDSKMLMGIGAMIGLDVSLYRNWLIAPPFLLDFIVYSLICGAIYGLLWSIWVAIANRKEFMKDFKAQLRAANKAKIALLALAVGGIVLSFFMDAPFRFVILAAVCIILLAFYAFLFIRAVEKSCMLKRVLPQELTEGDWIAEDVVINGKRITGPKDLGIEKDKIELLKKLHSRGKVDRIKIKVGIPFVPSFLFAFILATFYTGAWLALLGIMVI